MSKNYFIFIYFLILMVTSCASIEDSDAETKSKSSTYTEKVTVEELLSSLKKQNLDLALFIENNPVSNLRTYSGPTNYYFDHKNITAVKNNKNEAAYSIPLYLKSDTNSNILYKLSVEIGENYVNTKLIILEGMADGSINYKAFNFDLYNKKSYFKI